MGTQIAALTLDAATGGTPPFTYALSNVPNGLSFNTTSRALSGTPTAATSGAVTLTYTATDDNGAIARRHVHDHGEHAGEQSPGVPVAHDDALGGGELVGGTPMSAGRCRLPPTPTATR